MVQHLRSTWPIHSIAGNVEYQIANEGEDCGCGFEVCSSSATESKKWYAFAQETLSPESVSWMQGLPRHIAFRLNGKKVLIVHGTYAPQESEAMATYIFKSTPAEIKRTEIEKAQCDILVGNHSGLPFVQKIEDKLWINPGSIGLTAHESLTRAWYAILEAVEDRIQVSLRALSYPHALTIEKIEAQGPRLSQRYADILAQGYWDAACVQDIFLANGAVEEAHFTGKLQEQLLVF